MYGLWFRLARHFVDSKGVGRHQLLQACDYHVCRTARVAVPWRHQKTRWTLDDAFSFVAASSLP